MEATLTSASRRAGEPVRGLPPGPRMPRACRPRSGRARRSGCWSRAGPASATMFTLKIAYEGTWVMLADPELVKQVFTGDPRRLPRRRGQPDPAPDPRRQLGPRPRREAATSASAGCCCRPSTASACRATARRWREIAAREIDSWPTGTPTSCARGCRRSRWRSSSRPSSASHDGEPRLDALRDGAARLPRPDHRPALPAAVLDLGPEPDPPRPRLPPPHRPGRRADRRRDRRAPRRRRPGRARRHPLDAARRPPRGRQPDERRRDPRRAPHPAASPATRRPRRPSPGRSSGWSATRRSSSACAPRSWPARTPT